MSFFQRLEKRRSIVDGDPHTWDLSLPQQHEKRLSNSSKHPKTVIPDLDIFRDAIVPSIKPEYGTNTKYPNPGHVAAHLVLVECFLKLKQTALDSNDLGVLDLPSYSSSSASEASSTIAPNFQRWDLVVRLAVCRFQVWFENIESTLRHASAYHRFGPGSNASHAAITANYLPPLDVLLVWYAYMQKPSAYRRDNLAHETPKLLEIPMPWEAILQVVDLDTLTYKVPLAAERLFMTTTSQSPDILTYLAQPPPYTDLNLEKAFSTDLATAVHDLMEPASFANIMHEALWLRSPSLEGTLERGIAQYNALAQATQNRATLWLERVKSDPLLQLIWRTHMLYHLAYLHYSNGSFGSDILLNTEDPFVAGCGEVDDVKNPRPFVQDLNAVSTNSDTDSLDVNEVCHCWTCERIRDEDPNYYQAAIDRLESPSPPPSEVPEGSSRRLFRPRTSSQSMSSPPEPTNQQLTGLTKDQIASVKADVSFYRLVESCRQSNPPGMPLPTRPANVRDTEKQKAEKESKSRAGDYYGVGYTVEIIRPAIYDEITGRLLKKEKLKVTKGKNSTSIGKWGRGFMI